MLTLFLFYYFAGVTADFLIFSKFLCHFSLTPVATVSYIRCQLIIGHTGRIFGLAESLQRLAADSLGKENQPADTVYRRSTKFT